MIWVKGVELIGGDPEGGAEVWLTDGTFVCCCFAWPYYGKIGDVYDDGPITWLMTGDVELSDVDFPILKHLGNWEHFVVGKLVDRQKELIQVGEFLFDMEDTIPKDIQEGEYVEFKADRPDIY